MLSLENLRCFANAARELSFVAGARAVRLTPAAFGVRIRQLEDQVGQPLFVRTTRRVALTAAGLRLRPVAEHLLAMAADALTAAQGSATVTGTEITVGTRYELGISFVQPALRRIKQQLPWLQVHLYFGAGDDLMPRLRTQAIDIAIGSMRVSDPRLDFIPLHREDYVLVAAPCLLRRAPLRRPSQAIQHVLLDISPELPLFEYLRNAVAQPSPWRFGRMQCLGTIAALRVAVLAGDGVAVLPRYLVAQDLARKRLLLIRGSRGLRHDHFKLIFRRNDAQRPLYDELAGLLRSMPLR